LLDTDSKLAGNDSKLARYRQ